MRGAIIAELTRIAREDERVVLVTADLGYGVLDVFSAEFPDRFVNVGVAEQAMIGVATGLAEAGLRPYCYSIATFAMLRPFEFIRNGPVAHGLPVTVIGVGAGVDYSFDGLTHYAIEDLALARSQPGLDIYSPTTDENAGDLLREAHERPGPAYFRISRTALRSAPEDLRRSIPEPVDVLVLSLGAMGTRAAIVADRIAESGVSVQARSVLRFDETTDDDIAAAIARTPVCVVVEDHYRVGGLGSAVADVVASRGIHTTVVFDAIRRLPVGVVGSPEFLEKKVHAPVVDVVAQALAAVERRHAD